MTEMTKTLNGGRASRWRVAGWALAVALLLAPFVAMQFTAEMDWDESDFIVFGVMLGVLGGLVELAVRMSGNGAYRFAFAMAALGGFLMVWVNLAVGVIGSEDNPLNLIYGAVLATGVAGALIARFEAAGMARTLTAMAAAQVMVAIVAQLAGHFTWVYTVLYGGWWLASAALFRKAAKTQGSSRAT